MTVGWRTFLVCAMFVSAEEIFLTPRALDIVETAMATAKSRRHLRLEPIHIANALFADALGFSAKILKKNGGDSTLLATSLRAELRKLAVSSSAQDDLPNSRLLDNLYRRALEEKRRHGDGSTEGGKASVAHLLCVTLDEQSVKNALEKANVKNPEALKTAARNAAADAYTNKEDEIVAETFEALRTFATELVEKAEQGKIDPVIARDDEIRRCIQVLARRKKNNPVLVGPPGVGKTAIVEGLALRILEGDVPEFLKKAKVYALDMGLLMAGTGARGSFEARLSAVVAELQEYAHSGGGAVMIFIDEIHTLIGAGGTGLDAANLLKPALARGELRCLGATTEAEYAKYIEQDAAFERRLQRINVPEPSVHATVSILRGLQEKYEVHHGVRILDDALLAAAQLSDRFIAGRYNPDKAIDLIDEACARRRVELDSRPAAVDALERRVDELFGEIEALERETKLQTSGFLATVTARFTTSASSQNNNLASRVLALKNEHSTVLEELLLARQAWRREKEHYDELRAVNLEIEDVEMEISTLTRKGRHADAAEVKHTLSALAERRSEALHRAQEQSLKQQKWGVTDVVGRSEIAEVVSLATAIPVQRLTSDQTERLLELGSRLANHVVGQKKATDALADTVLRSRSGLQSKTRPRGAFLFVGPTGVGKTELAKALALELFEDPEAMVRLDMAEYAEKHSISRLVGAPPGYIGHDEGGQLTEAVRRRPYSVLLLDEAEKAHPDVFSTFLHVLDEGRLTDSKGRTVDFRHTYVILTSNTKDIRAYFKPEFLNRLDHVLYFDPLSEESLTQIAISHVASLARLALEEHSVLLTCTQAAARAVVRENALEISEYGARPLRRYVEQRVATDLARLVLSSEHLLPKNRELILDFFPPTGLHFRAVEEAVVVGNSIVSLEEDFEDQHNTSSSLDNHHFVAA